MKKKFFDFSDSFLDYLFEIRGYSDTSIITYEIAIRQMLEVSHIYEEDNRTIFDITPFRFNIVSNHKRTIAKKLSAIRSFIKYLEEQCNFIIKVIGDESIKIPQGLPKPIDEIYIEEVLQHVTIEERLLIFMLYGLGIRISELSNLELKNIKEKWVTIAGKGKKQREVPLLRVVQKLIELYIKEENPQKYLFEKGKSPLNQAQLRYRLMKPFRALGLKATPHQLRHSFASHLLNNGARISDVSELLGHASMATTQIYKQVGDKRKKQDYMKAHPLAGL
ncbi:MAG: tyrosine-type recombinase/integrase [Sulfurovum sp.]